MLHILGAQPDAVAQPMGVKAEHENWFSDGVAASLTSLGCLCILQAARGELEASGRGSLHGHWELWALAATMLQAMEKFQDLPPAEKLRKLKLVAAQWLNFFQRSHHSSVEHLPKIFGQDKAAEHMVVTKDMMHRCRMDGQVDAYAGYRPQNRPLMTQTPMLDLPKKLTPDNIYEPSAREHADNPEHTDNPEQSATASDNTPVVKSVGAQQSYDPDVTVETEVTPPPAPHPEPRATKRPIRGQALTALPRYRRIRSLKKGSASNCELSAQEWLVLFVNDAWQVQARAMLHVCGPSCWKYNKSGTKICRRHCYHIVTLQPDPHADAPADKELKIRCDGRHLNNQLFIMEDHSRGKRGRICPIAVCCFETMSAYVAAAGLRCNFDNQSLVYLPPASVLPLEWAPNIGRPHHKQV